MPWGKYYNVLPYKEVQAGLEARLLSSNTVSHPLIAHYVYRILKQVLRSSIQCFREKRKSHITVTCASHITKAPILTEQPRKESNKIKTSSRSFDNTTLADRLRTVNRLRNHLSHWIPSLLLQKCKHLKSLLITSLFKVIRHATDVNYWLPKLSTDHWWPVLQDIQQCG